MILCCGEALIDMIPSIDDAGQPGFTPHTGGAVFNTAIALGRLGINTGFLSGLSTDLFGRRLKEALRKSRVNTSLVITTSRPTTLAFLQIVSGKPTYTFYNENTAGRILYPVQLPETPEHATTLFFGGISLINEPAAEFYQDLAMRESADRVIVLDPNVRVGIVADEERYRSRLVTLLPHTDILKLSDEDLNWMIPGPADLEEKAARLSITGPRLVIITKGPDGAVAFRDGEMLADMPGASVTVVDTVGAGDTFNAGVLARLSVLGLLNKKSIRTLDSKQMRDVLALGNRVAGISVSRSGADSPWDHEIAGRL